MNVAHSVAAMPHSSLLKRVLVEQFDFVEWTTDKHLRRSRFAVLRDH